MRAGPNPFQAPQILSRSGQAMGLLSLMWNFYLFCFDYILVRYVQYGIPDMYSIDKRPGPGNQWMEELYDNLDMIFVASGPLFETPRQVAPIVKQIPGLTIKPPTLLNSSNSVSWFIFRCQCDQSKTNYGRNNWNWKLVVSCLLFFYYIDLNFKGVNSLTFSHQITNNWKKTLFWT